MEITLMLSGIDSISFHPQELIWDYFVVNIMGSLFYLKLGFKVELLEIEF
jgi:hypothetical protein